MQHIHRHLGLRVEEGIGELLAFTERTLDDLEVADIGQEVLNRLIRGIVRSSLNRVLRGAIGGTVGGTVGVAIRVSAHGCDFVKNSRFRIGSAALGLR